jgi:hypothetical protein
MAKNLATEMAPPFNLVAHYFLAGGFFYALTSFVLPFFATELDSSFVSTTIAGLSHLFLLGFVMMVIFGAMYQLVPVILEIPIFSKDFAYIQFYLFVTGILLMCYAFFNEDQYLFLLSYGALAVYISMLIFAVNIFLTYKNLEKWTTPAKYIFASNIFLFFSVTIGLIVALNLKYGFLSIDIMPLVKTHIAGVLIGYVMMTIMGVSLILIPMFALSHGYSEIWIEKGFNILVVALPFYFLGTLFGINFLTYLSTILIAISIGLFIYQMWIIFSTRIRKQNDYWAKNMMAAFVFLLVVIAIMIIASIFDSEALKMFGGYLLFFGFFITIVVGHIYKILPFLVWYQRFSPLVGKIKVPMLNDMVVEDIADKQFWVTLVGTLISALGVLFGFKYLFVLGTIAMGVGALMVIYNMYYILTYKKGIIDGSN